MSTRCQIGFYEAETTDPKQFEALIYRHSDGYPDTEHGVVADIVPFFKWFDKARGMDDLEYVSARLLQHLCNMSDKQGADMRRQAPEIFGQPDKGAITGTLGHGICREFHGDIEYFYRVTPQQVFVYRTKWDWHGETPFTDMTPIQTIDINQPAAQATSQS